MSEQLTFATPGKDAIEPYLPSTTGDPTPADQKPFVTLTFATSLDSSLSLAPGVRTRLSGPESKAMTHYLRSRHDAILVGVSTLLADDPGLNCRIEGATSQPRPIVVDPHLRWTPSDSDKVLQLSRATQGLAPFVLTGVAPGEIPRESAAVLEAHGGRFIHVDPISPATSDGRMRFSWPSILEVLRVNGLTSVMVEGGGRIINTLLHLDAQDLIDSVIVTIAPTWLGQGGVVVSPERVQDEEGIPIPAGRLSRVKWHSFGEDVVLCGTFER